MPANPKPQTAELLACPFCGAEPRFIVGYWSEGSWRGDYVRCDGCGAVGPRRTLVTEPKNREAWNTRLAHAKEQAAGVDQTEIAKQFLAVWYDWPDNPDEWWDSLSDDERQRGLRAANAIKALAPAPASSVGEGWIERVAVGLSDKIIMRLDIEEDDRRLSGIIDELRADLSQALATADRAPAPADLVEALELYQHIFTPVKDGGFPADHPGWGKKLDEAVAKGAAALAALRSPDDLAKGRGK